VGVLNKNSECLLLNEALGGEFRELAVNTYLKNKDVLNANKTIDDIEARGELNKPEMLLKKASVYGLQSRYEEAIELLVGLNKEYPRKPSILKRLALAYEQIRQPQKAIAYLKVYRKVTGDDVWVNAQMEKFRALGVM
jgi:tetratricopeptide (TPR) repeat protein